MILIVLIIAGLTLTVVVQNGMLIKQRYVLRNRHMSSLFNLMALAKQNLPPLAGELFVAAIDEKIDEI